MRDGTQLEPAEHTVGPLLLYSIHPRVPALRASTLTVVPDSQSATVKARASSVSSGAKTGSWT